MLELTPVLDRDFNVDQSRSDQANVVAGQLLNQFLEPRIVSDDHHGLGVNRRGGEYVDDGSRLRKVESWFLHNLCRPADHLRYRLRGGTGADGVRGEDQVRLDRSLP